MKCPRCKKVSTIIVSKPDTILACPLCSYVLTEKQKQEAPTVSDGGSK
jgi:ribosomal protein S27E